MSSVRGSVARNVISGSPSGSSSLALGSTDVGGDGALDTGGVATGAALERAGGP